MAKLKDLSSEDRRDVEEVLEVKATELGMDSYDAYLGGSDYKLLHDIIGMCASCKSLQYCKTEFNKVFAKCGHYEITLSGNNRIVDCNSHNPRGVLSLEEMYALATLIDLDDHKIKGFVPNQKKKKPIEN